MYNLLNTNNHVYINYHKKNFLNVHKVVFLNLIFFISVHVHVYIFTNFSLCIFRGCNSPVRNVRLDILHLELAHRTKKVGLA